MARNVDELSYETAIRALDQQERRFEELRARAGTLLAVSSLVLSILIPAQQGTYSTWLLLLALGAFLISAGTSLLVLVPRSELVLSLSPVSLYDHLDKFGDHATHRQMVIELHGYRRRNDRLNQTLTEACRIAAVFLALETVLMVAIRSGGII